MKKSMHLRLLTVLIVPLLPFLALSPKTSDICHKTGLSVYAQKSLLTQEYVDTTVMRALYILNEAQTFSGMNNKQNDAIIQAKQVLNRLKQQAKGDPNEKYALWKISEVEYQINFEEEEVRRIADEKRVLTANQLVIQYNSEVGKTRPDFATLRGLFRRMSEVDTRQANNLADSYNKRYRQISREAMVSLEKALVANDADLAKRELEYCEKNKFYLMISDSRLSRLRERFEKLQNAHNEVPRIEAELSSGERAAFEFRLSESRASLIMARNRISEIQSFLPQKDASALSARVNRALRALDSREDSLVRVAMSVLEKQGPDAASEYLHDVLQKRMNMSNDRTSFVDQAILRSRPEKAAANQPKIVEDYASNEPDRYEMLTEMQEKARKRAQDRADSIRAVHEKVQKISLDIYTLLEQNRFREASQLLAREKLFLSSVMAPSAFEMLELTVTQSAASAQQSARPAQTARTNSGKVDKNRQRADEISKRIYTLIENNKIKEAYNGFEKNKKPLKKHMDRDAFKMLEITVTQSYNAISN
ncbi:MAG: hypothetical protein LBI42_07720 [Chitinispirillales bacterium]|jgi:hypothetical protein|nr:hypothetical protein [Chitinispirillales bacterium]